MAFCRLIGRLKFKQIPNHFARNYITVPLTPSLNHASNPTNIRLLEEARKMPSGFLDHVRFFASSAQVKKVKDDDVRVLNEEIRVPYVRLVTEEGHFVLTRNEALQRAKQLELDLVLIQKDSDPPVCKIMDYHKERYKRDQAGKERAKSKKAETKIRSDMKEVRFASKIEEKDLKFKAETAVRMMERGYRVKCMAITENNKEVAVEKLVELLSRFTPLIEESAIVESGPILEKRQAYVVIRHVKFGPSKKGGMKKLKDINVKDIPLPPDPSTAVSGKDDGSTADDKKTDRSVSESGDDEAFDLTDDEEKPAFGSSGRDAASSSNGGRPSENRYLKKEPTGQYPPGRWMDNRGPADGRDAGRVDPRFRNQTPNQQFSRPGFPNQQPPRLGFPNHETNQQPPRPGFPNHAQHQQPGRPGFPNNAPNQQSSRPGFQNQQPGRPSDPVSPNHQSPSGRGTPGNPASGYGIFSNQRSNNSNRDYE